MGREQRKLVAIVAADAVGYSRSMERDEAGTLARLRTHRKLRFEPAVAQYGGRIVKLMGDGALAEFPSAVDALSAAILFQQSMSETNGREGAENAMVFRIGLHVGDVILEDGDVYGDGVNVAARLEALAPESGILVSRGVRDAVEGRLKATFDDQGLLSLKNIQRQVHAFRVVWDPNDWAAPDVLGAEERRDAPARSPASYDRPSIAVLPFVNLSSDPDQDYFVEGVVEEIISALSRFNLLSVIAHTSTLVYKDRRPSIRQIADDLGVRYILEGSARRAGPRLRMSGQLVDSDTGTHLWADRFESSLGDVFDLQDQLAASVVGAIVPKLNQAEIERARRKPVESLDAYDCFLRGQARAYRKTEEAQREALRHFYRAIDLAPDFAAPYGSAARCYQMIKEQGWTTDPHGDRAEVKRLVSCVSTYGQDDALALSCAGSAMILVCGEFDAGSAMVERALSLNPNLVAGWRIRALVNSYDGEHDLALQQCAFAQRLSPFDPEIAAVERITAMAHLLLGNFKEGLKYATSAITRQPDSMFGLRITAMAHALNGNLEQARAYMTEVTKQDPEMRLSRLKNYIVYRRAQDVERIVEGFRLAGMPE